MSIDPTVLQVQSTHSLQILFIFNVYFNDYDWLLCQLHQSQFCSGNNLQFQYQNFP